MVEPITHPVPGSWVNVRPPHTDRIVYGRITYLKRDKQGDIVEMDVMRKRLPWVAENSQIFYKHANDPVLGIVPLGPIFAYLITEKEAIIGMSVHRGNPVVDDIWTNEIQPMGTRAGFSIGGAVPASAKSCVYEAGKKTCTINDAYLLEASWTPYPANDSADVMYVNQVAKAEKQVGAVLSAVATVGSQVAGAPSTEPTKAPTKIEEEEKCKPECDKKETELDIKAVEKELEARLDAIYHRLPGPVEAGTAIMGCGTCDDYVTHLVRKGGYSVAQAMLKLEQRTGKAMPPAKEPPRDESGGEERLEKKPEEKKVEDRTMAEDEQPKKVPPEQDYEARFKSLEDKMGGLVKSLEEMRKTTVGTGTGPLEGVGGKAPEDINRTLMATTKSDEEMIKALMEKGYYVGKVNKGIPDNVPSTKTDPAGLREQIGMQKGEHPVLAHYRKFAGHSGIPMRDESDYIPKPRKEG